jgi:hypothetical protein
LGHVGFAWHCLDLRPENYFSDCGTKRAIRRLVPQVLK